MTTTTLLSPPRSKSNRSSAHDAYEELAQHYDLFTDSYEHDRWLAGLEAIARHHGLAGHRALDVACGTGKSFVPLQRRGYTTTACDISPKMVQIARSRSLQRGRVFVADMRELPPLGPYDLVTCLDDAINYLLSDRELVDTFRGIARALAHGGLLVFDVNSLHAYRSAFTAQFDRQIDELTFQWRGHPDETVAPGTHHRAELRVVDEHDVPRSTSHHLQRHHPAGTLRRVLRAAGLRPIAIYGQTPGAHIHRSADEAHDTKVVWLCQAAKAAAPRHRERR